MSVLAKREKNMFGLGYVVVPLRHVATSRFTYPVFPGILTVRLRLWAAIDPKLDGARVAGPSQRCWREDHPVQTRARRNRYYHGRVQERFLRCVECWRSVQDTATLERPLAHTVGTPTGTAAQELGVSSP